MLRLLKITNFVMKSHLGSSGLAFKTFKPTNQSNYLNILKLQFREVKTTKPEPNESIKKNKRMRVLSSDEETEEEVVKT